MANRGYVEITNSELGASSFVKPSAVGAWQALGWTVVEQRPDAVPVTDADPEASVQPGDAPAQPGDVPGQPQPVASPQSKRATQLSVVEPPKEEPKP